MSERQLPIMEPYRIKVVEPLASTTPAERRAALERAGYNLFNVRSDEVIIDLFTDSGTSAMSVDQWSALMRGDESYAGAKSWFRFVGAVRDLTGFDRVIPVHQGRAAEHVLFAAMLEPGQLTLSNTHFDTTRANVELSGGEARDIPCAEAADLQSSAPFKGNIDIHALERILASADGGRVAAVIMTMTNNAGGGQPVSMANVRATRELCDRYGTPLLIDAARFAENAWLVTQREPAWKHATPRDVARAAFDLADGCMASLKKDGIANIGGLIALRDGELASRCKELLIAYEGFPTYGGLAGRDLEVLAQGLEEVTDPGYLEARASATAYLAGLANDAGVPTVQPPGCHAVYVDAGALLPHIPASQFPAHALSCELYLEGGIRSVELGSLVFGSAGANGEPDTLAPFELLRLALPRRVYTASHLAYVGGVLRNVAKRAGQIPGYRIVEAPTRLRHFSARLEPITGDRRPGRH
ncbi:MAG: tryptophanase [bacterium]